MRNVIWRASTGSVNWSPTAIAWVPSPNAELTMTGYGVPGGTDGVSIDAGSCGSPGVPATTGPRSATSMARSSSGSRLAS